MEYSPNKNNLALLLNHKAYVSHIVQKLTRRRDMLHRKMKNYNKHILLVATKSVCRDQSRAHEMFIDALKMFKVQGKSEALQSYTIMLLWAEYPPSKFSGYWTHAMPFFYVTSIFYNL